MRLYANYIDIFLLSEIIYSAIIEIYICKSYFYVQVVIWFYEGRHNMLYVYKLPVC